MKKRIPIGIDDFKKVITQEYYYIDKTGFIKELLDSHGEVNLFTRPRRFGKSLNLSMLQYFFENTGNTAGLFKGLDIAACGEHYMKYQGQYPVISLSLKGAKQHSFDLAFSALKDEISREYNRHRKVLEQYAKRTERIGKILREEGEVADYQSSLYLLSEILSEHYDKPVIILIDEYDVPLESAYFSGYYDEMVSFIRSLLESALKSNRSLFFAVLTGCLRISKESIFTGLNNLDVNTIMQNNYQEQFGFLQSEVDEMLAYYELSEHRDRIREWYDGYNFGEADIYNPWSVICAVRDLYRENVQELRPYWANTSSNEIIRRLLKYAKAPERQQIEALMRGETIEIRVHEDITYGEIMAREENLWNFMFFTGYLNKVGKREDGKGNIYVRLAIPNAEVRYLYENHIINWTEDVIANSNLDRFYTGITEGRADVVQEELNQMLVQTISYDDYRENFYHGVMLGLLAGMDGYLVKSNREAGLGRCDIILEYGNITGCAVIFELEWTKDPAAMEQGAADALQQIEDQAYDAGLKQEGFKKILKYGICFYKKACIVRCVQQ